MGRRLGRRMDSGEDTGESKALSHGDWKSVVFRYCSFTCGS